MMMTPEVIDPDIGRAIERGRSAGCFYAAQCATSGKGLVLHHHWYGHIQPPHPQHKPEPTTGQSLFDLGEITETLVTFLALLYLIGRQQLILQAEVAQFLPILNNTAVGALRLENLLSHSSFLPSYQPEQLPEQPTPALSSSYLLSWLASMQLATVQASSALNFALLGCVIEAVTQQALKAFVVRTIYQPLGLQRSLCFASPVLGNQHAKSAFVTSGFCPLRQKPVRGVVLDPLAWRMGGNAGHAGLFGTAQGVWSLGQTLLECALGKNHFFHGPTLLRFWRPSAVSTLARTIGGWQIPTAFTQGLGKRSGRTAVGQQSSTGCALWIDWHKQTVGVLLTNAQLAQSLPDAFKPTFTPTVDAHAPQAEGLPYTYARCSARVFELMAARTDAGLGH